MVSVKLRWVIPQIQQLCRMGAGVYLAKSGRDGQVGWRMYAKICLFHTLELIPKRNTCTFFLLLPCPVSYHRLSGEESEF